MPALLAVASSAIWAERLGLTDTVTYEVSREMAGWQTIPAPESIARLKTSLNEAVAGGRNDPSAQQMLGRLSLLGTGGETSTDEAIEGFSRALQQRPTSPYSWSALAEALYRKGDTGPHFEHALRAAVETGPWEPVVQRTIADYGLAVWSEVSPSTRTAIEQMVANGMVRDASGILQISLRRGRLGVACAHLGSSPRTDPKWIQICQSTEAT